MASRSRIGCIRLEVVARWLACAILADSKFSCDNKLLHASRKPSCILSDGNSPFYPEATSRSTASLLHLSAALLQYAIHPATRQLVRPLSYGHRRA